jgi:outer membrane protein OmpA-like peptidoglycan-associated protein
MLLAGCGGPSEAVTSSSGPEGVTLAAPRNCLKGSSLTLIIPVHRGAQAPDLPQQWQCAIESALTRGVPINIVTAEGKPQVVLHGFTAELTTINPDARQDDLVAAQNTVINAATRARATSPGDDLLAAQNLAADLASTSGIAGQIMSLDNGLTDTGVLRIADDGMTGASPDQVASFVTANRACANLKGKTMQYYALGFSSAPQEPLSQRQRDTISKTYVEVAKACGAATAEAIALPRTGPGPHTPYTTKPVTPDKPPTFTAPTTATAQQQMAFNSNSVIRFQTDSANLTDSPAATQVLTSSAAWLVGNPSHKVTITGTTSSEPPTAWPNNAALARARADTIRQVLIQQLRVRSAQITVVGAGYTANPPDGGPNHLNPASAALNRAVTLTFS